MTTFQAIKKFFSPMKVHPKDYFWNIFEGIAMTGYLIFSLEITRDILSAIQAEEMDVFYSSLWLFFGISLCISIGRFGLYKTGWIQIVSNGTQIYMDEYMQKYIQAEAKSVEKIGTGRFLTILEHGLHMWFDLLFNITFKGTASIFFTLFAVYSIFVISPIAGYISLALFVISGIMGVFANIWMMKKRYLRRDAYKESVHTTSIMIMSKNELLQNNHLYKRLLGRARGHLERSKSLQYPVNLGFLVIEEFPRTMLNLIRIGMYVFIAQNLWAGTGSFADIAIFITTMALAERALNEFLHLMRDVLREFSSVELLWKTFDSLPKIQGYETGANFKPNKKGGIQIKNISFGYDKKNPIFNDFSLSIPHGKKFAIVGSSGGGKTSLMKLIAGYLHPEDGNISVLGNELNATALKTYYPHIGYLTQEPGVFDATIRENLLSVLSDDDGKLPNDEKIEAALRGAHCDFVWELENGLDTEIGERGVRLSGGQKQRLAIAKIFLKNPEIILLDEPTSALDSFSEEHITKALDELFVGRTVVIIAHRLQTVKKADEIIVLEGGRVVEHGNHEELIKKGGLYNKMLELQSGF